MNFRPLISSKQSVTKSKHQLIFITILPRVDSFYILSMDKNRHFLTPSPLHLVHVFIEFPHNCDVKLSKLTKSQLVSLKTYNYVHPGQF